MFDDTLEVARVASVVHDPTGISAALDSFLDDGCSSSSSGSSCSRSSPKEHTRKNINNSINKIASAIADMAVNKLKIRDEHKAISQYYNYEIKSVLPDIKQLSYDEMLDSDIIAKFSKCVADLRMSYSSSNNKEMLNMADFLMKVSSRINQFLGVIPEHKSPDCNSKIEKRLHFIELIDALDECVDHALTSPKILKAL